MSAVARRVAAARQADAPRPLRRRHRPTLLYRADAALLGEAAREWRKVAWLVGAVYLRLPGRWQTEASIKTLLGRIAQLVADGRLEAAGNIRRMTYSEARLPNREGTHAPRSPLPGDRPG